MDLKQLAYLRALGIQVWVDRSGRDRAAPETMKAELCAEEWERLAQAVAECTACPLHQTRTRPVFGVGNRRAAWMLIGEAPGEQEDLKGEPFVGPAGQLLNEMLRALRLKREEVYITNLLKSRPPGNRDPRPEEVAACAPFLMRQIDLVRPQIILAVGRIAAQNLLQTEAPLSRLRGKAHYYKAIPVIVIYHPAYLLRNPAAKRQAWEDLKFAWQVYSARSQQTHG
nr:DNA polymerase bacteriophage-type [uncultured Gammaproteobacteria bacterium]